MLNKYTQPPNQNTNKKKEEKWEGQTKWPIPKPKLELVGSATRKNACMFASVVGDVVA